MLSRSHKLDAVIVTAVISDYAQAKTCGSPMPDSYPNPSLGIEPTCLEIIQPASLQVMVENPMQQESDSEGVVTVNGSSRQCDSTTDNSNEENHDRDSSHDRIEVLQQLIDIKVRAAVDIGTHILFVTQPVIPTLPYHRWPTQRSAWSSNT